MYKKWFVEIRRIVTRPPRHNLSRGILAGWTQLCSLLDLYREDNYLFAGVGTLDNGTEFMKRRGSGRTNDPQKRTKRGNAVIPVSIPDV